MVLYYGKRVESALIGARLVAVECENCGCRYFYELARTGTGRATAPYAIGTSSAIRSSQDRSQRDLQERLAREAELVPCPECNWINDELVRGYRRGRFRRAGVLAVSIGTIGTAGSLIGAWFISIGPAADRHLLPYFLYAGPAIFVSLGAMMMLLRAWLRNRIQPNRHFPLPPQRPPGSPPALLMDEETGELRRATLHDENPRSSSEWHEFQIGRHELPNVCCECLEAASPGDAYKTFVAASVELRIPRCSDCARRSKREARRVWLIAATLSLLLGAGVSLLLPLESTVGWVIVAAWLLVSAAIASYVASAATAPVRVGRMDPSRGILRLRFRNPNYRPSLIHWTSP